MSTHKKHKVINITFYIFVFLMLFYIVVNSFFPEQSVNLMGFKSYVVVSDSMEPDIMINDLVIVTKVKEENLEIGDAISFYTYLPTNQRDEFNDIIYLKSVVTHYLADIVVTDDDTIYKTHRAGVPIDSYDDWNDIHGDSTDITYNDIIGGVRFVIPNVGVVLRVFTNPIMVLLIVVNIGIIVFVVKVTKKALSKDDKS